MVLFCSALNLQAERLQRNIADAANVWRTNRNAEEREKVKKELKLKKIMISHIRKHQSEKIYTRLLYLFFVAVRNSI